MFLARYRPLFAAALLATAGAHAAPLLTEGFDDVGTLAAAGWIQTNVNPDPATSIGWFQGQDYIFPSHSGASSSYIASNYSAAPAGTTLDNWLISPTFSTAQAGTVTFWLRGAADLGTTDTVRVGFSSGGSATGDFTVGNAITAVGDWTEYTASFAAGGAGSTARFAIEYTGDDDAADYIGIDDVRVDAAGVVPEPSTWLMLGMGVLGLAGLRRRAAR